MLRMAWKGSLSSLLRSVTLGKSRQWTSMGSSMLERVTMIWLGCSLVGIDRISAATSSAHFHLLSCTRRRCAAHALAWITFRYSSPDRGLNTIAAPFIGRVALLPSNVRCTVTRYTLVSSTNQIVWLENSSL